MTSRHSQRPSTMTSRTPGSGLTLCLFVDSNPVFGRYPSFRFKINICKPVSYAYCQSGSSACEYSTSQPSHTTNLGSVATTPELTDGVLTMTLPDGSRLSVFVDVTDNNGWRRRRLLLDLNHLCLRPSAGVGVPVYSSESYGRQTRVWVILTHRQVHIQVHLELRVRLLSSKALSPTRSSSRFTDGGDVMVDLL